MRRHSPSYADYDETEHQAGFAAESSYYDQDYPQYYNSYSRYPRHSRGYRNDYYYNDLNRRHYNYGQYENRRDYYDSAERYTSTASYYAPSQSNSWGNTSGSNASAEPARRKSRTPEPTPPPVTLEPTEQYIQLSQSTNDKLPDPTNSRKLLILDLNGTLLYRSSHTRKSAPMVQRPKAPQDHASQQQYDPYKNPNRGLRSVHPRPFMSTFRDYLFHPSTRSWLDTMVWSSAQPHSVSDMVEKAFAEYKDELVAVWARDTLGLSSQDYNRKAQTTKDLAKPWAALSLSEEEDEMPDKTAKGHAPLDISSPLKHSALTTLLLDDSPLKAQLQPWNHVCIREYVSEMRRKDLAALHAQSQPQSSSEISVEVDSPDQVTPPRTKDERKAEKKRRKQEKRDAERALRKDGTDVIEADFVSSSSSAKEENNDCSSPSAEGHDVQHGSEDTCQPSSKRKRRNRPKDKRKRLKSSYADSIEELPPYDNTLLAIIGILETVKHQSNVSSWIRSGGLFGLPNALSDNLVATSSTDIPSSQEGVANFSDSSPDDLAPPSLQLEDEATEAEVTQGDVEDKEEPLVKMWFDEDATVQYWARRGIDALDRLNIPLIHGIKEYN